MQKSFLVKVVASAALLLVASSAFAMRIKNSWGATWGEGMVGHEVGNSQNTLVIVASDPTPEGYNQLNVGGVTVFFDAPTGKYYTAGGDMIVTPVRNPATGVVTVTVDVVGQSVVDYIDWINADL